MKYFIAITLITAVASVPAIRPLRSQGNNVTIQSPSTNSDTAAALEQILLNRSPRSVVKANPTDSGDPRVRIVVTVHQGTATTSPVTVYPSHVHVGESVAGEIAIMGQQLVHIFVNIEQTTATTSAVSVGPIDVYVPKSGP